MASGIGMRRARPDVVDKFPHMSRTCRVCVASVGDTVSVRKRSWKAKSGERKEAWIVDYVDQAGERHIQAFDRKKDADDHARVKVDVRQGVHTPHNKSIDIAQAADDWIAYVRLEDHEQSTIDQYRQHVDLHIVPRIGREKLASLTTPRVNKFRDELLTDLSRAMAKKVPTNLKALLREARQKETRSPNRFPDRRRN